MGNVKTGIFPFCQYNQSQKQLDNHHRPQVAALREEIVKIIREKAGGIGLSSLLKQS